MLEMQQREVKGHISTLTVMSVAITVTIILHLGFHWVA
jgi:hypothetical protein